MIAPHKSDLYLHRTYQSVFSFNFIFNCDRQYTEIDDMPKCQGLCLIREKKNLCCILYFLYLLRIDDEIGLQLKLILNELKLDCFVLGR